MFVADLEKALGWTSAAELGGDFARGQLPDPALVERLLTPHRLLEMTAWASLDTPQIRVLRDGEDVHQREFIAARVGRRRQVVPVVDTERLGELIGQGAQVIVDALGSLDSVMDVACQALQWRYGMTTQANAYLSTGPSPGFPLHCDTHTTVIVQVAGSKRWEVRGPARRDPLYVDRDPNEEPPEEVVWSGVLRAGEVISIPRGWWHRATRDEGHDADADDRLSLHVTFGLQPVTGIDWITGLSERALDDPAFRADLGAGTDHADLAERLAALAREVCPLQFLTEAHAAETRRRRIVTGGAFGPPQEVVATTPYPPTITQDDPEGVVVVCGGRKRLDFAGAAGPALRELLSGRPVVIDQVADDTGVDAHTLAGALIEEGLCGEVTPALRSAYTALA